MKRLLLLLALAAPFSRAAIDLEAVAPAGFTRGVVLTVDGYAADQDRATLANFPVLVRISPTAIPGFAYSDCLFADGSDVRFLDAAGTLLPSEVDEWNADGESLVWVSLPSMTNGTEFAMVYGSGSPGTPSGDVWARYAAVIHGGASIANSVSGGPDATAGSASVAAAADAGRIGGGIRKSAANAIGVNVAKPSDALSDAGKFTVSAWFKRSGNNGNGTFILGASRPGWSNGTGFLWLQEQGKYISVAANNSHQFASPAHLNAYILPEGAWAHAAFAYESGVSLTTWFEGAQDNRKTSGIGTLSSTAATWTFGSYQNTGSNDSFVGDMDELRIFDGVATDDWIRAERDTVADASFLSAGTVASFASTPAPVVGLSAPAADVLYTNATLTAVVGSFGKDETMSADAGWADLLLVVSAGADLADPLFSIPLGRATTAPATMSQALVPLATNATYYARLLATNEFGVAGESGLSCWSIRHMPST